MKIMLKYACSALVGVAAMTLASCSDNDYEYEGRGQWDAAADYANVYFPETDEAVELDPADPTTYTFQVGRRVEHQYTFGKDSEGNDSVTSDKIITPLPAKTMKVKVLQNTGDVFTVSDAQFAEGDTLATVTASFPNAEVGTTYTLQLTVDDPQFVSQYSEGILYTLDVTRVKWNDVGFYYDESGNKVEGWCMYTDDFVTGIYGVENLTYPVKVQERDDMPGVFRIKNAYGEAYGYNDPGDWDPNKDFYMIINASNPKKVYFDPWAFELGMVWSYGSFIVRHLAGYYESEGKDGSDYFGTYANGAITFPPQSFHIGMSEYNGGGYRWYANANGKFKLVINPDLDLYTAQVSDYGWEEVYSGIFTSTQLDTKKDKVKLYKAVRNAEVEAANEGCYDRFEEEYGTPYLIESPYAEGYNVVFSLKDGEIKVPEGYESQPLGFKAAGKDVYGAIGAGGSTFGDIQIDLKMTFQDESGEIIYGTAMEQLLNFVFTKDMVLGNFTYMSVLASSGKEYNLGNFTIVEHPTEADSVIIKNLYLEGSEIGARLDLNDAKLYVEHLGYLGIEEDEGTPYYVFTYSKSGAGEIAFEINTDGTLTSTDLILVGSPDLQSLYYWFNASSTTFVPVKAGSRALYSTASNKAGKKGGFINSKGITLRTK